MKQSTLDNPVVVMSVIVGFMLLVGLILFGIVYLLQPTSTEARTYPAAIARIGDNNRSGSTTQQVLGAHVITQLVGTSTCVARSITTTGGDVTLSFYDGAPTLGQYTGHLQTASTTAAYDSDQYGCGLLRIFAIASTSVSITESN